MDGGILRDLQRQRGAVPEQITRTGSHGSMPAMAESTVRLLLDLNRRFYEQFAAPFAESRGVEQPGLLRALRYLPVEGSVLDVGCGNGRLAQMFDIAGRPIRYLGIDSSPVLVQIAQRSAERLHVVQAEFLHCDVVAPGWTSHLPTSAFTAIAAIAVLHHLPSWRLRLALVTALRSLLDPGGLLLISAWQFGQEIRLQRKIVPWSAVGLTEDQVEPGDALLDWQRAGRGLRYCHQIDEAELSALVHAAGMTVAELYRADGQSQKLNLFAVLKPASY